MLFGLDSQSLPFYVYDKGTHVARLGDHIGRTLRVDESIFGGSRGKFARVSVELDLKKPLISKFGYDDTIHRVEYEVLHTICFECGVFKHKKGQCPTIVKSATTTEEINSSASNENTAPR